MAGPMPGRRFDKPTRRRVKPTKAAKLETWPLISCYKQATAVLARAETEPSTVNRRLLDQANRFVGPATAELKRRAMLDDAGAWTDKAREKYEVL